MLENFHFLRPLWLLALPLLPALLVWWSRRRDRAAGAWARECDAHLLIHMLDKTSARKSMLPVWLLGLAWVMAVTALAGPVWQELPQPVFRQPVATVVVLDMSRSMNSADLKPSRLARARFKLLDLLKRERDAQVGLVAYAGDAFVISPLTDDGDTVAAIVPDLKTDIMPVAGKNAVAGLQQAVALLRSAKIARGQILLVTDGLTDSASVLDYLSEIGAHRVSILGVGTSDGAPVPDRAGGFEKRADGALRMAGLDEAPLRLVVSRGGGKYRRISNDDSDLDALLADGFMVRNDALIESTMQHSDQWQEEGPWLLLLCLPLTALVFRRGWLFGLLPVLLIPPQPVQAFSWSDLWLRPDQQAAQAMNNGDTAAAAERFADPAWRGSALYRDGRFADAAAALAGSANARDQYNRGNALARAGDLEQALAAYEQALQGAPDDADTQFNHDLVEQLLQQQKQQQQQQQQSQSGDENGEPQSRDDRQAGNSNAEQGGEQPADDKASDANAQANPDDGQQQGQDSGQQADPGEQEQPGQQPTQQASSPPEQAQPDQSATPPPELAQDNGNRQLHNESDQLREQWLRRIPDDPGGLLKQKLILEHLRRQREKS